MCAGKFHINSRSKGKDASGRFVGSNSVHCGLSPQGSFCSTGPELARQPAHLDSDTSTFRLLGPTGGDRNKSKAECESAASRHVPPPYEVSATRSIVGPEFSGAMCLCQLNEPRM